MESVNPLLKCAQKVFNVTDDNVPQYRVRLFLSVDLAGSTAFKNKQENPIDWVPKFKDFYSSFSDTFSAKYEAFCSTHTDKCEDFRSELPKLWKTVGDEVIFVNRVTSAAQALAYVHAFTQAMDAYSKKLKSDTSTDSLDVKGNGWLASFPYPNQTITIRDPNDDLVTEEIEKKADEEPHQYEFLGSGIDSGFRISKNSTPSFFTVSPSLALLLCLPSQNANTVGTLGTPPLVFNGVNQLKGVINGEDFPIIGIYTERDPERASLVLKNAILSGKPKLDPKELIEYLTEFENFHAVSSPALKLEGTSKEVEEPAFYRDIFLPSWKAELEKNNASLASYEESSSEGEGSAASAEESKDVAELMEQLDTPKT